MKVYKVLVGFDDSGGIFTCDAVEHEGGMWLVPMWLEEPATRSRRPLRIVRMDTLPHQKMPANWQQDFVLNEPMPRAVFEGRVPQGQEAKYVVIEAPEISLPIDRRLN
jgi:hypothetical protein